MRYFLVFFFLTTCAPVKTQVEDYELERILERAAEKRFYLALTTPPNQPIPSDWEIFSESCKIYRIDPESAYLKLQEKKPEFAKQIRRNL